MVVVIVSGLRFFAFEAFDADAYSPTYDHTPRYNPEFFASKITTTTSITSVTMAFVMILAATAAAATTAPLPQNNILPIAELLVIVVFILFRWLSKDL